MANRLERPLLLIFALLWVGYFFDAVGLHFLADRIALGLYPYFSFAAVLGWMAGNLFTIRRRQVPEPTYRSYLLATWLGGPPVFFFLLGALQPRSLQEAQPLVPVWALGIYLLFFVIPVSLDRRS